MPRSAHVGAETHHKESARNSSRASPNKRSSSIPYLDGWPEFVAELACCYVLVESRTINGPLHPSVGYSSISWRLYLRRNESVRL